MWSFLCVKVLHFLGIWGFSDFQSLHLWSLLRVLGLVLVTGVLIDTALFSLIHHACVCAQPCSCVWLFVTPWTVARQAPLSMGFSRQEYRSGLPCPSPGDLPDPRIEPWSLTSPPRAGRFFTTSATGKALIRRCFYFFIIGIAFSPGCNVTFFFFWLLLISSLFSLI